MKEPYDEGLANHIGPESCITGREVRGEALTGVCAGWVLSREIYLSLECRRCLLKRKATPGTSLSRGVFGLHEV